MKQFLFAALILLSSGTTLGQPEVIEPPVLDVGVINEDFVIGKSRIDEKAFYRPKMYDQGKVPYQNWKDRKAPLPWNYNAEVVRNTSANIATDTGRYNQARFVPGYRTFIDYAFDNRFGRFSNIELLFHNDTMISFISDVDTGFYKTMTRYCGNPVIRAKKDSVICNLVSGTRANNFIITTTQYTWKKGNNKTEIIVTDYIDSKCIRRKKAVYQMTDMPKYAAYLKKVEEEVKRLEKKYTAQK